MGRTISAAFAAQLALLLTISGASAEDKAIDRCAAILSAGLLDLDIKQSDGATQTGHRYFLCGANEEAFKNHVKSASGQSGGGGGKFEVPGVFSIGGSGQGATSDDVTTDVIRNWKSSNCTEINSELNQKASTFSVQRRLRPDVVEAWKACIIALRPEASNDLQCFFSATEDEIQLEALWRSNEKARPDITDIIVSRSGHPESIPHSQTLLIGQNILLVPRKKGADHRILMKTKWGHDAFECSVLVPKIEEPPLTANNYVPAAGKWCSDQPHESFSFGEKVVEFIDGGGHLISRHYQERYYPPGWPEDQKDPTKVQYDNKEVYTTIKPGMISKVSFPSIKENLHDGVLVRPTDGYYFWPVHVISRNGRNLEYRKVLVKGTSNWESPGATVGEIEGLAKSVAPTVYEPC